MSFGVPDDESAAHLSSGLGDAAFRWIAAVRAGETHAVWADLDDQFRLVLAQQWIHDNPAVLNDPAVRGLSRDDLATELAAPRPSSAVWHHCARVSLRAIRSGTAGMENLQLGQGARTRPVAPGLEIVHLIPTSDLPKDQAGIAYHLQG
jgi:hypothetical protein